MTAVALHLSSEKILEVKQTAKHDVAVAQKCVGFAVSMVGHFVDAFGSRVVAGLNRKLTDSLVSIKGLIALVPELDPNRVLDPHHEISKGLGELQRQVSDLHGRALKARGDIKLRRTHEAFRDCVELCAALHEAVGELKKTIADHDSKATMGDDARRLIADLKRTDDVPAGRYAELAAVMRRLPKRSAEDRSNDPAAI